jgi:hypothetical protein
MVAYSSIYSSGTSKWVPADLYMFQSELEIESVQGVFFNFTLFTISKNAIVILQMLC